MLPALDSGNTAPFVAAHVTTFPNLVAAASWRRRARHTTVPGLVFAKAMPFIGSRESAGFAAGVPALQCQVLLTAWRRADDFDAFRIADGGLAPSWWALFEVTSARGSYRGTVPLRGTGTSEGPFAALTLGRTSPRRLAAFLSEGARLAPYLRSAPGLLGAVSAGIPVTGNCTLSLWQSEDHMHAFAYADARGHVATARRRPPILIEQLNARMRVRKLGGRFELAAPYTERLESLAAAVA